MRTTLIIDDGLIERAIASHSGRSIDRHGSFGFHLRSPARPAVELRFATKPVRTRVKPAETNAELGGRDRGRDPLSYTHCCLFQSSG